MARIFGVSPPTVSRIVAEHRLAAQGNGHAERPCRPGMISRA